jgi:hypothetical protein
VLNCATAQGRALAHANGEAAQPAKRGHPCAGSAARRNSERPATAQARLMVALRPYTSPHPIEVTAPGLHTTLPANLDRPGMRWSVGSITITGNTPITVTFHPQDPLFAPPIASAINALIATPDEPIRVVPLRQACGRYVEWYTTSGRR